MTDYNYIYKEFIAGRMRPLYSTLYSRLIIYASRILGTRLAYMAEDCVQSAILNMYLRRDELSDMNKWRAWLLITVRNNAIMQLRGDELQRRYHEYGMLSKDEAEDISLAIIEQEVYTELFAAVDSLPDIYKDVFSLSYEEGLKIADIAERLNIAEITVKKRKAKLIELLRSRLGSRYGDLNEGWILFVVSAGSIFS